MYLHNLAWERFAYQRNRLSYDIVFSVIQKKRNLKPNPYLADTARHLFAIAMGGAAAYMPALNDDALPVDLLQKIFITSYGMKKYLPAIMQPVHFYFEKHQFPVYYSLQHPSTFVFSPKSRKISSTLSEMRELEHIMKIFIAEISKDNSMCSDAIISQIGKNVEFNYFHNEYDRHHVIKPSTEILSADKRFDSINHKHSQNLKFASDAPFLRGCISMKVKS